MGLGVLARRLAVALRRPVRRSSGGSPSGRAPPFPNTLAPWGGL
jgi:hypothetical protein